MLWKAHTFINLIQTLHGSHYRTKLCTLLTVLTRWVDLKRGDKDAILWIPKCQTEQRHIFLKHAMLKSLVSTSISCFSELPQHSFSGEILLGLNQELQTLNFLPQCSLLQLKLPCQLLKALNHHLPASQSFMCFNQCSWRKVKGIWYFSWDGLVVLMLKYRQQIAIHSPLYQVMDTSSLESVPNNRKWTKLLQTRRQGSYMILKWATKVFHDTLSIVSGMNFCPPNPGSTVITRTISTGFSPSTCKLWTTYTLYITTIPIFMLLNISLANLQNKKNWKQSKSYSLFCCNISE